MFGGQSKKRQTANLSDVGEIYPMKMSELTSVQETDVLNPSAEPVAHRKNKAAADRWDSEGGQAAADPAYHYDNERLLWRDSQYVKYFKMKKDGIKENVILHKMKLDGADPAMLKKGPKGKSPNTCLSGGCPVCKTEFLSDTLTSFRPITIFKNFMRLARFGKPSVTKSNSAPILSPSCRPSFMAQF